MSNDTQWAGKFGAEYNARNDNPRLIEDNYHLFTRMGIENISTAMELGCGYGYSLLGLKKLFPELELNGIEINNEAADQAADNGIVVTRESIYTTQVTKTYDLVLTKGMLIYTPEESIDNVYKLLYDMSNRYICICEYYNPSLVVIDHRGIPLYKRDYGRIIDLYPNLKLTNYGFVHKRDKHPQDDVTWFLFEK